jgi:hypothetical protein
MGTGTYAPRRTRASQPARDQTASLRAAAAGVSPRAAAVWLGVTMGGRSRSSLLNCLRDAALRPLGVMRYILSDLTSALWMFRRFECSVDPPCPSTAAQRRRCRMGRPIEQIRTGLLHPTQQGPSAGPALRDRHGTIDLSPCPASSEQARRHHQRCLRQHQRHSNQQRRPRRRCPRVQALVAVASAPGAGPRPQRDRRRQIAAATAPSARGAADESDENPSLTEANAWV